MRLSPYSKEPAKWKRDESKALGNRSPDLPNPYTPTSIAQPWQRMAVYAKFSFCGTGANAITCTVMFRAFILASALSLQGEPAAVPVQPRVTQADTGREQALDGELIRKTPHFDFYAKDSFVPVDMEWLAREAEVALAYVSERIGIVPSRRLAIAFRPPRVSACPPRGLAYWNEPVPQLILFANRDTSNRQILGVLAHEAAHLLHRERAATPDTQLSEGLATWASGKYWEAWQETSIAESVRSTQQAGLYVPLTRYYGETPATLYTEGENCLRDRDLRYTTWAGFLDFLIRNYGREKLFQLLGPLDQPVITRPAAPSPPDFIGVFGLTLNQLEAAWHRELALSRI